MEESLGSKKDLILPPEGDCADFPISKQPARGVGHIKAGRPEKMRSLASGCYTAAVIAFLY